MLFADVAAASRALSATRSRTAKTEIVADLLRSASSDELPIVATWLSGALMQQRLGVGWASVFRDHETVIPAAGATLTIEQVDDAFSRLAEAGGAGSQAARRDELAALFALGTAEETPLLRALLTGELRQGALAGVVLDAVALAFAAPKELVRRAHLLTGDLGTAATLARRSELEAVTLQVGRAVQPMLASTSPTLDDAFNATPGAKSVEWKLDGARIQVHRSGDEVRIFTRNLNDITHRLPEVVGRVRSFSASRLVLDGEVLGLDADGAPRAFQHTISDFASESAASAAAPALTPFFFDLLHVDGRDLLDEPLHVRLHELERVVGPGRVPGVVTDDVDTARAVQDEALRLGHEGVMVKDAGSTYDAGRRGASWRKVKPVRTFDLVVLACEWGHGRRQGTLSNLHLGARDGATDEFVMVGKTFKGLTDALLAWQTRELLQRETRRTPGTVWVRPELVVEIAIDGVQHSTRYPGGVALRFARVKRYRDDKPASQVDTIASLHALLPSPSSFRG